MTVHKPSGPVDVWEAEMTSNFTDFISKNDLTEKFELPGVGMTA